MLVSNILQDDPAPWFESEALEGLNFFTNE